VRNTTTRGSRRCAASASARSISGHAAAYSVVSLVDDQQGARRQRRDEPVEPGPRDHRAGRVVRRRNDDELGARRDRGDQGVDITRQLGGRRRGDEPAIHHLGREPVRQEAIHRGQDLIAGLACCDHELVQQVIGAVAEEDVVGVAAEPGRQAAAQRESGGIGIAMQLGQRRRQRRQRPGRRPERVLVRGDLDDPGDAELALELLDRFPRLVDVQAGDMRWHEGARRRIRHDQGTLHPFGPIPNRRERHGSGGMPDPHGPV